jgi:hypothetical protein
MKYLVELRLKPDSKERLLDAFEQRGPNRQPGVSFRNAWIGTRSPLVFVLAEGADERLIEEACKFWHEFADYTIHPVLDIEQI